MKVGVFETRHRVVKAFLFTEAMAKHEEPMPDGFWISPTPYRQKFEGYCSPRMVKSTAWSGSMVRPGKYAVVHEGGAIEEVADYKFKDLYVRKAV